MPRPKRKLAASATKIKTLASPSPCNKRKLKRQTHPPDTEPTTTRQKQRARAMEEQNWTKRQLPPATDRSTANKYPQTRARHDDTHDEKERQIEMLSSELAELREEYKYFQAMRERDQRRLAFFEGYVSDISFIPMWEEWGESLDSACSNISSQWARCFSLSSTEDMQKISADDKKLIIRSLEGYCIQKEYDYLIKHLPSASRHSAPSVFLAMYVIKDMIARFYTNPFWYLSPMPISAPTEEQATFARNLGIMGKRFKEADSTQFKLWRGTTCRLANKRVFEDSTKAYRETLIRSMVSEVLSSKVAQLLLKEGTDITPKGEAYDRLLTIYIDAAEHAVARSFWQEEAEIRTLSDIDETFRHDSEIMTAAEKHFLAKGDRRLDGAPILGLLAPGLAVGRLVDKGPETARAVEAKRWSLKANVLVDDVTDEETDEDA